MSTEVEKRVLGGRHALHMHTQASQDIEYDLYVYDGNKTPVLSLSPDHTFSNGLSRAAAKTASVLEKDLTVGASSYTGVSILGIDDVHHVGPLLSLSALS